VVAVPDTIAPLSASSPADVVALVSLAVSDGDLDAALAQYEDGAAFEPWVSDAPASARGLSISLTQLMDLRLPLSVTVCDVLTGSGTAAGAVALVLAERRIAGPGPDCQPVDLRGAGATAVRQQADGSWRIAADAWCLAPADRG
jgi:ketosteroid isomerase-like protein